MKHLSVCIFEGKKEVHLPAPNPDYYTICGIDGGLSGEPDQVNVQQSAQDKITCEACLSIWLLCRKYNKSDFEERIYGR